MSDAATEPAQPAGPHARAEPPRGPGSIAWHWRNNPKRELWFAWYSMIIFSNIFVVVFFIMTHTQPPPYPYWSDTQVMHWFNGARGSLLIGFGIVFATGALTLPANALIAYSMRRMSVSRAFAYSYLVIYSLAALPGMLLLCVVPSVGAMRPGRDPVLMHWLYDSAFLSYVGTMGIFLIGSLVWMLAILLDKNRVLPKWFAYLDLCNALTEVVVSPAWIFHQGVLDWNGLISWWINMVVFGTYTSAFMMLLRTMIQREDFGDGPLPDLPKAHRKGPRAKPASLAGTAQ
jgi:hypothetical protein